jgi:hypothetical protein
MPLVHRNRAFRPSVPTLQRPEAPCPLSRRAPRACARSAPSVQVWKLAQQEGLSLSTLRRAKKHLPVRSEYVSVNRIPISYWLLPGQSMPSDIKPQEDPDPVFERLRQLEEQYPSRSPLDDL